ncbi:MAG: hypothetical protein JW912_07850 [Sedimentisphaerales bacterium]|nr:hypothetical protein [Sedimentisphaerales bacterium]
MSEEEFGTWQEPQHSIRGRDYAGYILVICGVSIGFWVFIQAYSLFTGPEELTRFQELVSEKLEATVSAPEIEGLKIVIPSEIFSYFIPVVLLMLAAGVARMFISSGVRLLDTDVQRISRRITTLGLNLKAKMNRVQDALSKNS